MNVQDAHGNAGGRRTAPTMPPALPVQRAPGRYAVLLIEDDAGDAVLVEEYLADTGLSVDLEWAQTLADGLARLKGRTPDCILLDLHLPDASGTGAVQQLQTACPAAAVIVLTGMAESSAGAEAVAAGAQDYLVKGAVTSELLDRALRYAVHRKHAERTATELRENHLRAQENTRLERGLLPTPMLSTRAVVPTSCYLPGREGALLAGDFLDVVETADGVVHAVIGDVSGHGPDEAAIGVCLRIAWRSLVLGGHRESGLLALMEQVLVAERPYSAMFATVATISLHPDTCRIDITLAGHDEPLLVQHGTARPLPSRPGLALGIGPGGGGRHTTRAELPPAASLLLHTDGLVEGHSGPGHERLGTTGLLSIIDGAPRTSGQGLVDHLTTVTRKLDAGRHLDDLAILLLSWDFTAPEGGGRTV
ncbi:PP2C family protein-serine/threonine phosphatase [Streptomyces sp. RKAG337]|uniref:PP2C family protein-serine/threonine phosphatase n=1 Tax=Streptomyces sp. RKAG337 TaxID=2893404 RepID=UPI0020341A9B|nr:fused response regulator/phosphatase [Streptomyces sp. RKAG337]MCM2430197.1 fused response regulator/phosphatase [Streptomyces sp. RKAG337]